MDVEARRTWDFEVIVGLGWRLQGYRARIDQELSKMSLIESDGTEMS